MFLANRLLPAHNSIVNKTPTNCSHGAEDTHRRKLQPFTLPAIADAGLLVVVVRFTGLQDGVGMVEAGIHGRCPRPLPERGW